MRAPRLLSTVALTGFALTATAAELPMYRPALLGTGSKSLVNQIDTKMLMQKGQKDAAVMFSVWVADTGAILANATYRGTPGSQLLEQEVQRCLASTQFVPAVYNRKPVHVFFYGTVMFAIVQDKPRLRIFSNQETEELKKENDFISPQPFIGGESKFSGMHYPTKEQAPIPVSGVAELSLKIDATGNVKEMNLLTEYPPFLGFGEAALTDFGGAKFIPAFRKGQPVESTITLPVFYKRDPLPIATE